MRLQIVLSVNVFDKVRFCKSYTGYGSDNMVDYKYLLTVLHTDSVSDRRNVIETENVYWYCFVEDIPIMGHMLNYKGLLIRLHADSISDRS